MIVRRRGRELPASPAPSDGAPEGRPADRRALRRQLRAMRRRERVLGIEVFDVQPVVQVCPSALYPAWAERWRRTFAASPSAPPEAWPDRLPDDHFAALLLPVAPDGADPTSDELPTGIVDPVLMEPGLPAELSTHDVALRMLLHWLRLAAPGQAVRLAPPVVEHLTVHGGANRTIATYGERWDLAAARY